MKNEPKITPELVAAHGLKPDEYERILKLIGREPTFTELGIFSAMWNEHCSYKSSRIHLRGLPTKAPWVIQGPGENAGVIDIGDGQAVVFKMESHNHPSYIEPYQGATTGVGGILRDVFTMGARPIACLNALSFGAPEHARTRHLVSGVVAGVGGYGNSFGVPTVGGQVRFHTRYDGNILVNAMAVGARRRRQDLLCGRLRREHADRLSRLQDRPRWHSRCLDGLGGVRRQVRGEAPDRAGRRSLRRKTAARGVPGDHGEGLRHRHPGHGRGRPDLLGSRDGRQGRPRRRPRSRRGADARDRHERLRDDALGKPGAHAHGAQAREGKGSRGHLQEVGPRLRRGRLHHAEQALCRQAWRRRHGRPADQGAR
ncbi:hypothetical protein ACVWXQ_003261 [Bradyrhizobium sp. S3.14.4]